MPNIVFPASSAPGVTPQESGGRLINAFAEKAPVGAPSTIIHRRSPGLERMLSTGLGSHTRGFLDNGGEAIWVLDNKIIKFNSSFGITDLGVLTGTDPVTFGRNNAATPDMVVVTSAGCFNLFSASPPTVFASPNLPANPTSVCDYDGYFIWSFASGQIYASDLNSVNVQALSFTTEQGLVVRRVVRFGGNLFAFGDKWTGVYKDAGTSPFPLSRQTTIPRGIVGTHAIAGWESGWANELVWVGDDFVVYQLNGYIPNPVSTDDVSRDIQAAVLAGNKNLIQASVYMFEKNAFWVLTCPGSFTWEYNLASGEWNERESYNRPSWKGLKSLRIFDQWLVGDVTTGDLYRTSGSYFLEGTEPLIWQAESGALVNFPMGMVVPRASFHITTGVGTLVGVPDPKVEISWSLDGGYTYGLPVIRRLGGPGMTKSHPYVLNCGLSRGQGVRYRLRVSDPVHVGLNGGVIEAQQGGYSG